MDIQVTVINSLMERKRECGLELATDMILKKN